MRVIKFGGSSVADSEQIKNVIAIVGTYITENPNLIVVVSAQAGVTDNLVSLCDLIPNDCEVSESLVKAIEKRHVTTLKNLLPVAAQPAALAEVLALCNDLADITKGASLIGEVTSRTRDLILSFGERLSAFCMSAVLKSISGNASFADARKFIRTNDNFGFASVDFGTTNKLAIEYFSANKGLQVVTGFIATSAKGQTTTLGRSGSDYTAAILGAALLAESIDIWTDVDGVMTADPRFVEEAQNVEQLSYSEAMELSHFGAKVIFPATMQPAMAKEIPIWVKNTFNPSHPGTLISKTSGKNTDFVKGITSLKNISLITVEGSGMVGVAGVSARMFTALSQHQISVVLISQASSEHSICIAIQESESEKACQLLSKTFEQELLSGQINSVHAVNHLAIVAVVGENMRNMPGVASRVFSPLGRNGININAISQGSSELNISIVIGNKDLKKALRILHQSLFNQEMQLLHLFVVGTGAVGSRMLEMIAEQKEYFAKQKISLKLCGITNSRNMLLSEKPIDLLELNQKLTNQAEKANLNQFVETILQLNLENSVFVDVTASDSTVTYYNKLLAGNVAIVAANKRANTQSIAAYHLLHATAKKRNVPFNYETNVGSGLPVINVLRSLMVSGDKVTKIEAVLSGTMNYLLSEYSPQTRFSQLVKLAKESGYTEPDPRDDLSGMDVARKCLILARECGWEIELADITVEPLMNSEAAQAKDVPAFFEELEKYNPVFNARYQAAQKEGKRLRYVAVIENGTASVKVLEVDEAHPFYTLKGTENCISLTTKYYQKYPMVIKGPGAGVDVTAAGVLADIVRIAEGIRS